MLTVAINIDFVTEAWRRYRLSERSRTQGTLHRSQRFGPADIGRPHIAGGGPSTYTTVHMLIA